MDREPLYQRIERLIRDRWAFALFLVALAVAMIAVPLAMYVLQGNPLQLALVAYIAGLMGLGILARRVFANKTGRNLRKWTAVRLAAPTRWRNLDQALEFYIARSGVPAPQVAFFKRAVAGDMVDAELVYADPATADSAHFALRGPLDARPGDQPMIVFAEAMLDSYSAEELLAVLAHLIARAPLQGRRTSRQANGAREADSKALLLTHDHAALLRALEKSVASGPTPPPEMGIVKFADTDLELRKSMTGGATGEWVTRDRLVELRTHLGPASLDVPERTGSQGTVLRLGVTLESCRRLRLHASIWLGVAAVGVVVLAAFAAFMVVNGLLQSDVVPLAALTLLLGLVLCGVIGFVGYRLFADARHAEAEIRQNA